MTDPTWRIVQNVMGHAKKELGDIWYAAFMAEYNQRLK